MRNHALLLLSLFVLAFDIHLLLAAPEGPILDIGFSPPENWSLQSAELMNQIPTWTYQREKAEGSSLKGKLQLQKCLTCSLKNGPEGAATDFVKDFVKGTEKWRQFCKSEGLSLPTTWTFEAKKLGEAAKIGKAHVATVSAEISRPSGPIIQKLHWFLFSQKGPMWLARVESDRDSFPEIEKELTKSLVAIAEKNEGGAK